MFLGMFGSYSLPIIVGLLVAGGIYYGISKVNNSNLKNKNLDKDIPVALVVFSYMAFSAAISLNIRSIVNILYLIGCFGAAVGIVMRIKNKEKADLIVGVGLIVLGLIQLYNLINAFLIMMSISDYYDFGIAFSNFHIGFKLVLVIMGLYGLFILLNKKYKLLAVILWCLAIISFIFEGIVSFAIEEPVNMIYSVLISLFYVWGIYSLNSMYFSKNKVNNIKMLSAVIIVIVLLFSPYLVDSIVSLGQPTSIATATCQSCGRTFSAGDIGGNYINIAKTGFCNNCYKNYKWAMEQLGK